MDIKKFYHVPHLQTAQQGAFYELEKHILEKQIKIETWFREIWLQYQPTLTSSVDLRNAGFKICAVDTNVYPAGFNNLNPDFYPLCIQAAQNVITHFYPYCKKILIIPENHTRNPHYYQSLFVLSTLLQAAGYEVKIGSLIVKEITNISLTSKHNLVLHPVHKHANKLCCDDFVPCLILLNNDLSEGVPPLLQDLKQPIDPVIQLGWSTRSKTHHFSHYHDVCKTFASLIDIDDWQINPLFLDCGEIDFVQRTGMECLVSKTEILLAQIQKKYDQYQIKNKPFVMVKADKGTYGMAVMPIHDPNELNNLNRKQRTSMSVSKGRQTVKHVIIQEGVPTNEKVGSDNAVAEPVVYMLGQHVVGGFYRVHHNRGIDENLNSPGMDFKKLAFAECCNNPQLSEDHSVQNQFYVYSVIARLALIATCKEKLELMK